MEGSLEAQLEMEAWCKQFGQHPRVVKWLKDNPPPSDWRGTPAEFAYAEMLFAPGW
jgi:hypothetical protein